MENNEPNQVSKFAVPRSLLRKLFAIAVCALGLFVTFARDAKELKEYNERLSTALDPLAPSKVIKAWAHAESSCYFDPNAGWSSFFTRCFDQAELDRPCDRFAHGDNFVDRGDLSLDDLARQVQELQHGHCAYHTECTGPVWFCVAGNVMGWLIKQPGVLEQVSNDTVSPWVALLGALLVTLISFISAGSAIAERTNPIAGYAMAFVWFSVVYFGLMFVFYIVIIIFSNILHVFSDLFGEVLGFIANMWLWLGAIVIPIIFPIEVLEKVRKLSKLFNEGKV